MDGAIQSTLAPHGAEAAGIAEITRVLVLGGAAIFVGVLALVALALVSPRPWLSGRGLIVGGGILLPLLALSALLSYTLLAAPRPALGGTAAVVIEVVGHQWWWEVNYLDADGRSDFATANEIHIPVGQTVELRLRSADVLHSLWVPALAGKLDLIPGRDNRLRVVAKRPAVLRGQCAEYCGGPHGQMALFVVAEEPASFEAWRAAQRRPYVHTQGDEATRGRALFLAHCAACHTVRGTPAKGALGPDLTHLASRVSLGAGILPNNRGTMAGWIAGNQRLKPHNLMPEFHNFDGEALRALAGWLESLK